MNRKKVILVSLSNGLDKNLKEDIYKIKNIIESFNLIVDLSKYIFNKNGITEEGEMRSKEFNSILGSNNHDYIIDVSGGDLSNELVPYINKTLLKKFNGIYIGYSDLSVIISLFTNENKKSIYFNIKSILKNENGISILKDIFNFNYFYKDIYLKDLNFKFIRGRSVKGKVIGGNIRCLLKLAGSSNIIDTKEKILFLESCSGDINRIRTYIAQYELLHLFENSKGIILGQFTEIDFKGEREILLNLFKKISNKYDIPLIETKEVGHSNYSKPLLLNENIEIQKF